MVHLEIIFRTVFFYLLLLVIFRIMGKREIGELSILDLIVYIMMAEVAIIAIENKERSVLHSVFPMLTLAVIQITFAYISLKSRKFRNLIEGSPSIVVENGEIKEEAMKKSRYNLDDLLLQLREKDVMDISEVSYAILEPSGKLSVLKKKHSKKAPPIPLIMDGEAIAFGLKQIQKDERWLIDEINKRGYKKLKEIFYCSFDDGLFYIDEYDELAK